LNQKPAPPKDFVDSSLDASEGKYDAEVLETLVRFQKDRVVIESPIKYVNRGGAIFDVEGGIRGFMPYSRMDPSRLESVYSIENVNSGFMDEAQLDVLTNQLPGLPIRYRIVEINPFNGDVVLSERAAYMKEVMLPKVQPGDVLDCVVANLVPFGAFVHVAGPDGRHHGAQGLIHISELSWDRIARPEQVLQVGQPIQAVVTNVDMDRERISCSLRRLEADPLNESLSGLLEPAEFDNSEDTVPIAIPQSILDVVAELQKEDGIDQVSMGRQVQEQRTVAQDLEIYISKRPVQDGYMLVARAGRVVQEVNVVTKLDVAATKKRMQNALKRLM